MNDLLQTPLTTRALVAARSVWISLAHLVSPARLSFAYPKWKPGMIDVVAVAAIPIVLVGTWAARAKVGRGAFAGCVLFLVLLVPFFVLRTDLDQYAYLADHLSYLAAMVFVAAVTSTFAAVLARRQSPTWKWPALLLAAAAASLLLVLTELRLPDYRNAEGVWRAALRRDPASAIANNHLGLIELNDRRDGAAAMEYFRAALRSDPGNTQTHEHIAGTYEFLHDYGKARDEYLQVLARSENDAEAHSGLARCLAALGHSDEAMREYEVVLKLAPNDVVALNNIGLLHDERGELDQAQAAFERAIKINPGYSPAYLNLGNLLYKEGKIEAGIAILARLLQIDRVNFRAYFNAGAWAAALASREEMAHDERVRLNEQAEILMTTAVQLRPGSSEAYFSLGKILLQKNTLTGRSDYGLAISFLERAVELDPENQGARQILQRARDEQTRSNPPSHR
jgi:tetratricopeptide (TPR) repeat protein